MAATARIPLIGRHMASLAITPYSLTISSGVISTTAATSLVRLRTNFDLQLNPQSEEINDDGSVWANNVTLVDDFTLSIDLMPLRTSATPFPVLDMMDQYEYFLIEVTFSAGGSTYPLTIRGKRGNIGINSNGRGAFREALNLLCFDSGTGADAPLVIGS